MSLVGKGIMYDSGGISLKPNDLVHAAMKTDMSGAAAILAAMSALSALGCKAAVTGYLMCTDNMPGGKAMRLGDVLTARGGKTVEVMNTDAEGRLVMMDGLVLATEEKPPPDAIVDIATLTGACERALGNDNAGVIGNHQGFIDQVKAAAETTDETVWQFPLDRRLRKELDSEVADIKNVGGVNAGQITAGAVPRGVRGRHPVGAHRHRRDLAGRDRQVLALQGRDRLRHAPAHRAGALVQAAQEIPPLTPRAPGPVTVMPVRGHGGSGSGRRIAFARS